MLRSLIRRLAVAANASPRLKKRAWRWWYRYFERRLGEEQLWFLNYGLATPDDEIPSLHPEDEENRASIQLYHRVAAAIDLAGLAVLEVSCGRGGGALYLKGYLGPRLVIGLDQTETALAFCRRHRPDAALGLVCGDALALPFPDASFDVLLNVEASHCYPSLTEFLSEARRVLRPNGHLLYADMRRNAECEAWRACLKDAGFEVVAEEELTEHVVRALTAAHDRKESLIRRIVPRFPRRLVRLFAATKGTATYRKLASGDLRYLRFVLHRQP